MTSEIIRRIIEETLARFGRDAIYDDYISIAHELFPDEMRSLANGFERQGFIKWLKQGLRQAANVGEDDPDAPFVQLDLMPGLPAPAYLNIGSARAPHLMRFIDALPGDLRTSIDRRIQKASQIGARVEDLQQKLKWLIANQVQLTETVGQVCDRLGGRTGDTTPRSIASTKRPHI